MDKQFVESLRKKSRDLQAEKADLIKRMGIDQQRLNAVSGAIAGIDSLLRLEGVQIEEAFTPTTIVSSVVIGMDTSTDAQPALIEHAPLLADVLKSALQDGKPHKTEELLKIAVTRGVDFGPKDPVKAVAMTLLGISRGKTYRHNGDGVYQKLAG